MPVELGLGNYKLGLGFGLALGLGLGLLGLDLGLGLCLGFRLWAWLESGLSHRRGMHACDLLSSRSLTVEKYSRLGKMSEVCQQRCRLGGDSGR